MSTEAPGLFPQTAWTLVQKAIAGSDEESRLALSGIVERYWRPIYVYLRRSGRAMADAEDATQEFFVHLLEKELLTRVRLREVRFRAFLRGVLEHFLANLARTAKAQKRYAGPQLDFESVEAWLQASSKETSQSESPQAAFDRAWALQQLEAAFARLREEHQINGREWIVDALTRRFGIGPEASSVADLAKEQGISENQLSVALHRARTRLRTLILEEIRDGVATDEEAVEDLNAMFLALGRSS